MVAVFVDGRPRKRSQDFFGGGDRSGCPVQAAQLGLDVQSLTAVRVGTLSRVPLWAVPSGVDALSPCLFPQVECAVLQDEGRAASSYTVGMEAASHRQS